MLFPVAPQYFCPDFDLRFGIRRNLIAIKSMKFRH